MTIPTMQATSFNPDSSFPDGTSQQLDSGKYAPGWMLQAIQRIRQSLDLDVVLNTTVAEVRQLLQVERVFLFEFQADWGGVVVVEDCAPHCKSLQGKRIYDECFAEAWVPAYEKGRVQAVGNIYQAGLTPCHLELLEQLQVRANLVVPLQVDQRLWGLLVAQHCTAPRPWPLEEVQGMQHIALQVGMAIQQSELYQKLQAELELHKQTERRLVQQAQQQRADHLKSIGTLAGGLAQNLSDVLTPIVLATDRLTQPGLDPKQRQQWLNRIQTSVCRSASLVDQVLSFAQGMTGQPTQLQLGYLLGELVQTLQETTPEAVQITLRQQLTELWTLQADPTQLQQVFMNLCQNALEAMPRGGRLQVEARNYWCRETPDHTQAQPGAYVVVTVTDTGLGMDSEVCDRSCDPFFTTRAPEGHTGLGLSTAFGLVQGYGGWLSLHSQLGRGTTVEVYLPAQLAKLPLADLTLDASLPVGHDQLILLVSSDHELLQVIKPVLESYHYRVLTAGDGPNALALYIHYQEELASGLIDFTTAGFNANMLLHRMAQIAPQMPFITINCPDDDDQLTTTANLPLPLSLTALLKLLAKTLG